MDVSAPAAASEPPRPLGVWILTISLGLMAGLVPLVAGVGLFVSGAGGDLIGPLGLASAVLLAAGIVASAVGTWRGSSRVRGVLVALAVAHHLALAFDNGVLALDGAAPEGQLFLTSCIPDTPV